MALAADTAAGPSWPRLLTGIVVTAAHWTLTWGFAAAVVTTRIAPPRPASGLGTLLVMRVAVSSALVLGTLASGGAMLWAAGSADRADAAPPQSAVETTGHPSAAPGPSSDPSDPPLPANPVADDAYAHRCAASAVRVTFQGLDAGLGGRYAVVAAVNTGQVRCVLKGFPDVAFADLLGNNVRVKISMAATGEGRTPPRGPSPWRPARWRTRNSPGARTPEPTTGRWTRSSSPAGRVRGGRASEGTSR